MYYYISVITNRLSIAKQIAKYLALNFSSEKFSFLKQEIQPIVHTTSIITISVTLLLFNQHQIQAKVQNSVS